MHTTVSTSRSSFGLAQTQQYALPVLFALFGLIMGSWAGRIPALAERVQVSHSELSMVLLCGGLGAVVSYPISSFLMGRFGARKSALVSGMALLCVLVSIGMAPTVSRLMLAVLMLGITASTFNVAINAAASKREKTTGKAEMSMLHGLACAGGLVGATLGSLMASMKVAPGTHFLMLAGPLALVLWGAFSMMDADDSAEQVEKKSFSLPRGPLALLGLLGFLGSMSEGSIADWSGVFLKEHFGASDGLAPLALSAFSVMMLLSRMVGDKMKVRFGAQRREVGDLRLEGAGQVGGRVDNRLAELDDAVRLALQVRGEARQVRVEPDAQQGIVAGPCCGKFVDESHPGLLYVSECEPNIVPPAVALNGCSPGLAPDDAPKYLYIMYILTIRQ